MTKNQCIICGEWKEQGISIWQHFICRPCEREMVHTDVRDQKYIDFIQKMRTIWLKKDA